MSDKAGGKAMDARVIGLELGVLAGVVFSAWQLSKFIEGMVAMQDFWNASDYVKLLLLGLFGAAAAVAASEALRRVDTEYKDGLGSSFTFIARAALALQLLALLYCNSGPVRAVVYTGWRVLGTFGMARDLPEPPVAL